ncbi:GTPase-activating protein [Tulasnella sp. UAMH 9824]|nr:GTPase-activating protein [Tulasnella sp. UAMH 9824]
MAAPPARPHIIPQQTRSFLWGSRGLSSSTSNDWGWQDDMDDDTWDSTSDQEDQGKKGFANKIGSGLKVKKKEDAPPSSSTGSSPNDNAPHSSASSTTPIPLANGRPSAGARGTSSRLLAGQTSTGGGAGTDHGGGSISSGNISFSFTHVDAPSPSSYPLKESVLAPSPSRQPTLSHKPSNLGESNASTDDEMARKAAGWTIISHDLASANRLARDKRMWKESGKGGGDDDGEPAVHMNEEEEGGGKGERDGESEIILGELELEDRGPQMARKRIGFGNEAIKLFAEDILKDPFFRVRQSSEFRQSAAAALSPPVQSAATFSTSSVDLSRSRTQPVQDKADRKAEKFEDCLLKEDVEMTTLRKLAWNGIPDFLRPAAWPLLLGYLPLSSSARLVALNRKREEYRNLVDLTFKRGKEGLDQQIWHQIEIDVPRTRPGVRLWMMEGTQRSLERILYVWAIRHPASGYVQGINDLVTPFYEIFLSAYIDGDPEEFDPAALPPHMLSAVEADSFWCLSRLLDGIQENYIQHQPGIQKSVKRMRELVGRIDPNENSLAALAAHLDSEGVEFMQFAFRWMNCLLMREISVKNTIRMWDTYLAEGPDAFSQFHLYVCCAFLVRWSEKLRQMDFQASSFCG